VARALNMRVGEPPLPIDMSSGLFYTDSLIEAAVPFPRCRNGLVVSVALVYSLAGHLILGRSSYLSWISLGLVISACLVPCWAAKLLFPSDLSILMMIVLLFSPSVWLLP
jgi:hypothetical protein